MRNSRLSLLFHGISIATGLAIVGISGTNAHSEPSASFEKPVDLEIVATTDLTYSLRLQGESDLKIETLSVTLDGASVAFEVDSTDVGPGQRITGTAASLTVGEHEWVAQIAATPSPSALACSIAKKRANGRDLICRFRAGVRARSRNHEVNQSLCDTRIRRSFARAEARFNFCPVEDSESRIAENTSAIATQLEQLGLGSGPGGSCDTGRARALARHQRCESRAQGRERRGRDVSAHRARCAARLTAGWNRAAALSNETCSETDLPTSWIVSHREQPASLDAVDRVIEARISIESADFSLGDGCSPSNSVHCALPYPSMAFLENVGAETETGYRMSIPQEALPELNGEALRTNHWDSFDGFSPTAPLLMNFPNSRLDLAASGAPILQAPGSRQSTPYQGVRVGPVVDIDGPTVVLNLTTGERIGHFAELDSRTTDPQRQVLFLRPDASLEPGGRYAVAIRNLVDTDGKAVIAEPAFRAYRDGRFTRIEGIEEHRTEMNELLERLAGHGISTEDLLLAYDFVVRSDSGLTGDMLKMRDDALRWIDENRFEPNLDLGFNLDPANYDFNCASTGAATAMRLRGTFKAPFYLQGDAPQVNPAFGNGQTLARDENGSPLRVGTHNLPFDIAIPCRVFTGETAPLTLVVGHGLFGTGGGMVDSLADLSDTANNFGIDGLDFVSVGTDFRGLSSLDRLWVGLQIIGLNENQLNNFPQFVARLQQGIINQVVLAHVMKKARFVHCEGSLETSPAPCRTYVFADFLSPADQDMNYYGISLGGVQGIHLAALSPDIEKFMIDVGAINFAGMLLQRSTQFIQFEVLTEAIGLQPGLPTALGLSLLHELWVSAESAGYVRHVTGLVDAPLPESPPKQVLMAIAWLDKQVSNEASLIAARSLGLPNVEGSLLENIPGMIDAPAPQDSGFIVWDAGSFDIFDPAYDAVVPPLANQIPSELCDPHARRPTIPDALKQLALFSQPGGQVENTCADGVCDASSPSERPGGSETVCDPL